MTTLEFPRGGALAYTDSDGVRQEVDPGHPMYSTATMLATERWTGSSWVPLYEVELVDTLPAVAEVIQLTEEDRDSLFDQLSPLPENPIESFTSAFDFHVDWTPSGASDSGHADISYRGQKIFTLQHAARQDVQSVLTMLDNTFEFGFDAGKNYVKTALLKRLETM